MIQEQSEEAYAALGLRHKVLIAENPSAPLVFLIHGRAGTFDVMWTFRRVLPEGCSIIAPQAPYADIRGGFSWWDVEKEPEPTLAATAAAKLLFDFMTKSTPFYGRSPRLQLALGFSQGAGLLSILIQQHSQLLQGVALLAGFVIPVGVAPLPPPLPEVLILHGINDEIAPIHKARKGRDLLVSRGFNVQYHEDPVGHKVGAPGMKILASWAKTRLS